MIRRQANLHVQLELFPSAGAFPRGNRRLLADNDSDPFASAPCPTRGVFVRNDGRKHSAEFRRGLTLTDLTERVGPADQYPDRYR